MSTISVELRNITKTYPDVVAVDNIRLKIKEGRIFSLLGPSGCGKTTTLRVIGGLENPDSGEILIDGEMVNNTPPYRRDCSIVFQDLALFPHMSVAENIAFGLERRGIPKSEVKKRVKGTLELVDLSGMGERRPDQLSGGQQQRIALARSLVLRPGVLLLDEPLASLDRKLRKEMQVEIQGIQQEVGVTFFYVTHDQSVALAISDKIAIMQDGKFVQVGTPEEIYEQPKTRFSASFMGATNIFSGRVVSINDEKFHLETESGLQLCFPVNEEISVEETATIFVRPEVIKVTEKDVPGDEGNKLEGKISEKVYQGEYTEIVVDLGEGEEITAHVSEKKREFSRGDEVSVKWPVNDTNQLID